MAKNTKRAKARSLAAQKGWDTRRKNLRRAAAEAKRAAKKPVKKALPKRAVRIAPRVFPITLLSPDARREYERNLKRYKERTKRPKIAELIRKKQPLVVRTLNTMRARAGFQDVAAGQLAELKDGRTRAIKEDVAFALADRGISPPGVALGADVEARKQAALEALQSLSIKEMYEIFEEAGEGRFGEIAEEMGMTPREVYSALMGSPE